MAFFVPKSPALICYWDFPLKCDIGKLCITSGAFGCDTSKCNVHICIYLKIYELLILVFVMDGIPGRCIHVVPTTILLPLRKLDFFTYR